MNASIPDPSASAPAPGGPPAVAESSPRLRGLLADRVVRVALLVLGTALAATSLAPRWPDGPLAGFAVVADPILLTMTLVALLWGRARRSASERRFWDLLGGAWACLLLVEALYFFDLPIPMVSASFVTDLLFVSFYLFFALVVDQRPHLAGRQSLSNSRRRLESLAGLMVIFGLLLYFALEVHPEPLGLSLSFVERDRGMTPFLLARLSLDLLILVRLLHSWRTSERAWQGTYALLAAAVFCVGVKDVFAVAQSEGLLEAVSWSFWYQVFLALPSFLVILAVRCPARAEAVEGGMAAEIESSSSRMSPLALYALVVPGMHFVLYPLGLLEPASRGPREIFCLGYLLVLGSLTWVHALLLAKEGARARQALRVAQNRLFQSERLETVGRLVGGIAHDFNNYLTVIQGYGELIQETFDDPKTSAEVGYIREAAEKAGNLTRQLLAFGGRQLLRPEAVDLNQVVAKTVRLLERVLGEDIELDLELDSEVRQVMADIGQIEQVFLNLALNSRDAMPDGGRLIVRTLPAVVDEKQARDLHIEPGLYVELSVSDTGCGMSGEVKARVFEPFFTTKDQGHGTGLGLSTVHGIIRQSGGSIRVESAVDRGTTLRLLLPANDSASEEEAARVPEPGGELKAATVLLVEDERALLRLAKRTLATHGFRVLAVSRGEEALEIISERGNEIDLLVTDLMMPEMDGLELATAVGSSFPDLPILFMSGYPMTTLVERGTDLPPSTPVLNKPFTPIGLVREVDRILAGKRAGAPLAS